MNTFNHISNSRAYFAEGWNHRCCHAELFDRYELSISQMTKRSFFRLFFSLSSTRLSPHFNMSNTVGSHKRQELLTIEFNYLLCFRLGPCTCCASFLVFCVVLCFYLFWSFFCVLCPHATITTLYVFVIYMIFTSLLVIVT